MKSVFACGALILSAIFTSSNLNAMTTKVVQNVKLIFDDGAKEINEHHLSQMSNLVSSLQTKCEASLIGLVVVINSNLSIKEQTFDSNLAKERANKVRRSIVASGVPDASIYVGTGTSDGKGFIDIEMVCNPN